ncbi:MAG TPA: 30S ribosomal protein S12 methylthiotransferase RimO [Gemmatimonadaceae bacterium]|nr:30S ribosomal protein S12 methylthiotransferase RimO [Gemmatimonadaceae bacterium]
MKVAVVTLGCDKNTVDSERYLAQLADRGAEPTERVEDADVILVNTCGFIDAAKKESIDAIVQAGRLKERGHARAVVAVGCMVERHQVELEDALPEVDLFLGASQMDRLVPELVGRGLLDDAPVMHPGIRLFSGDMPHVRYLKVSEGCDHGCAFCAIPLMRGRHRSFTLDDILREAQLLEAQGAREINLVAQDLAHYGRDLKRGGAGDESLPTLLEALVRDTSVPWIRMLYLYSAGITPRLLELVAREERIVPYFDMPMQHASDAVLKRMRRPERNRTIRDTVARVRQIVPDVTIRTTCIVGFPGETDDDFATLLQLLEEAQFDRVGAFTYSPQEGTAAYALVDDVPESVKLERLERLTELQRMITAERFESRTGRTVRAIVDRASASSIELRTRWQAHDIDGVTLASPDGHVPRPGDFFDVRVDAVVDDYDLQATLVRRVGSAPQANAPHRRAALPLASVGSYGR